MAPEQARGRWEDVDGRTDLWAVGATLYTLLSGKFVHSGESAAETLALAATRPARSLGERRPDLHPSLIRLVDRALAYDKAQRFPDAANMQHALRVTFAEISGANNAAGQLAIPVLQSIPASRAITLRNLSAPPLRPPPAPLATAHSVSKKRLWLSLLAAAAVLLLALAWLRWRPADGAGVSSAIAPPAPMLIASSPSVAAPSAAPPPSEPKAIRVDDLPQEPARPGARRR